jgi:hypothetical protein
MDCIERTSALSFLSTVQFLPLAFDALHFYEQVESFELQSSSPPSFSVPAVLALTYPGSRL